MASSLAPVAHSLTTDTTHPRIDVLVQLAVLAALYALINFVMSANTLGPLHQDDYLALGWAGFDLLWPWPRPVSSNIIVLAGSVGPWFSYALLTTLAIVVPLLTLRFFERLFALRTSLAMLVVFGMLVYSHPSAFEQGKLLGVFTNHSSHFFGMLALLWIWDAWTRGGRWRACLALLAIALSILAKEDFVAPPLLLVAYLWWRDWRSPAGATTAGENMTARLPTRWRNGLVLAVCLVVAASLTYALALADNPFVAGLMGGTASNASYAVGLTPTALLDAFRRLTLEYAFWVASLGAAAWVTGLLVLKGRRRELLLVAAITGSLMLPYAMLPNNMPAFRVYSWLAWLSGLVIVVLPLLAKRASSAGPRLTPRMASAATAIVGLALGSAVVLKHRAERAGIVEWYRTTQAIQRNMLDTLIHQRALLADHPNIGISGIQGLSPWSQTNAEYLRNRMGLDNRWIIFVEQDSMFFQIDPAVVDENSLPGKSHVGARQIGQSCKTPDLPVLQFDAAGHGRVTTAREICRLLYKSTIPPQS
ncbi:MAG: hypothetical protein M3Q51_04160 [Pseudomonadota bacterium]|nr:hypothetical protein [Pseudomonadota bacterium]